MVEVIAEHNPQNNAWLEIERLLILPSVIIKKVPVIARIIEIICFELGTFFIFSAR